MRRKIILFSLVGAFFAPLAANANSLQTCKTVADTVRKALPARKDSFTVVKSVGCVPGKPKNRFVYMLEVTGLNQDILKQIDVKKELKPGGLNQFCTDPNMRVLLNAFDVDHRYYTDLGVFIGSFLMKARECAGR